MKISKLKIKLSNEFVNLKNFFHNEFKKFSKFPKFIKFKIIKYSTDYFKYGTNYFVGKFKKFPKFIKFKFIKISNLSISIIFFVTLLFLYLFYL